MGNKNTKTKEDKKREQEEKKQYKKEQKAKKKSSKKSTNKKQRLARGENSESEFDTDFDSNHFTGADSESGVFHSAENLSSSPYLDSCTKSERENSGILWRPSSPTTSRHPQVLSSRDFRDGFSLEACIPPEIARPITYHTDTTISSSCSGGATGGAGITTPLGYNCRDNSSGSLKSKRSNSVKSHQQTPTFSRFPNDDVMSVSTSSSQKSSQTGTEGYCTPLLNTPVFGRADRPVSPHSGLPLGRLHEPDRDSMDIVPLPYSPFDPEAKVFTTYNPTIIRGNTSHHQQQHHRQHHFFTQPINYHNLPKPTSPHPQRRAFSPKMTSSPIKIISSDDSSSSPTTPIPQRKVAAALISDFFKSSGKKKKKTELEEDKNNSNKGEFSPKSKKSPLWKTWERSSTRKSVNAQDNKSSIFGTSRKTEKNKTLAKNQQQKQDQELIPQIQTDRCSDSTLQDYSMNVGVGKTSVDSRQPENSVTDQCKTFTSEKCVNKNITENDKDSVKLACEMDLNSHQNRNSSPPVARTTAFCIMRLEELERNIEKTIKEKFPDAEPFLLRRSPPEEEFRGSKSLPTTPSLKKKMYISRDVKLSSDDVMSTDLHSLSTKLDKLSGSTRYYDETFEDSSSRAKSPVILRRFGARTRHASISPKIQRAKTAAIYNSPGEMQRVAEFKDEVERTVERIKNIKKDSSSTGSFFDPTPNSQSASYKNIGFSGSSPSNSSSSSPKTDKAIYDKSHPSSNANQKSSSSELRTKTNTPRQLIRQHCVEYPERDEPTTQNKATKEIHQNTKPVTEEKVIVKTESAVFGSISPKLKRPSGEHEWKEADSYYNPNLGSNNKSKQTKRDMSNVNNKTKSSSKTEVKRKPQMTETKAQAITNRRSGSLDSLVDSIGIEETISQRMAGERGKQTSHGESHKARILPIPLVKHSITDKNSSSVSVKSRVRSINKSLSEEAAMINLTRQTSVRSNSSSESENVFIKSLPSSPTDCYNNRSQNRLFGALHNARTDKKYTTGSSSFEDRKREKTGWNTVGGSSVISPTLPRKHSADHVIFGSAVALPCRVYASTSTAPKIVSPTLSPTTGNRNQSIRFAHAQNSIKADERNAKSLECERKQNCQQNYREERKEIKNVKETAVSLPIEKEPGKYDGVRKVENHPEDDISNRYGNDNSSNNKNNYDKHNNTPVAQVDIQLKQEGMHNITRHKDFDIDGGCSTINTTLDSSNNNFTPSGRDGQDKNTTKICVRNERQSQVFHDPISDTNISNSKAAHVSDSDLDQDNNRFKARNVSSTVSFSKASSSGSNCNKSRTGKKVSGSKTGGFKGVSSHSVSSGSGGSDCGTGRDSLVSADGHQQPQQHQNPSRLFHQIGDVITDRTLGDSGGLQSGSTRNDFESDSSGGRCLHDNGNDDCDVFGRKYNDDKSFSKELPVKINNKKPVSGVDCGKGLWENNGAEDNGSLRHYDSDGDFSSSGGLIEDGEKGEESEVRHNVDIREKDIEPNIKQVKLYVNSSKDNEDKQGTILKQPISQIISNMINISRQSPPQQQPLDHDSNYNVHDQHHRRHNHQQQQQQSQTSSPQQSNQDALVSEETAVTMVTRPHSSVPFSVDNNGSPDIDNSKNEVIASASKNKTNILTKSSNESTTEDSDIERFMKSVKESIIPKAFGNEKGESSEQCDMDQFSSAKEGKQTPPPPSPNALDKLISEFDEEDEGDDYYEEDDAPIGYERLNRMRMGKVGVNLALTRQNEMKDFTDRVINRLSDLLGSGMSGAEYILDDDDDVFVDDSMDSLSICAKNKSVSKDDVSADCNDNNAGNFNNDNNDNGNNNDVDNDVHSRREFPSLEITNSKFDKESLHSSLSKRTPPKTSPVLKERPLYSRFSTSSSLSTSSTSSTSSSELFAPPPPQSSSTMPGYEGFEKSFDNTKCQSKSPPTDQKDILRLQYSQQLDQFEDGGNRNRRAQTRSYHSDDDVARGGGIPEYYDDKPLWSKRQKPPGQISVKMASVRRRERRERWLKKRKRNRTDFISACSSEVASEHSSNYGRSRLSLDGDFEDEEVTNLSSQTQKGALGSGILTSPKYTKPIMPFWGSGERIKTPPEPAEEELIHSQHRTLDSESVARREFIDIEETFLQQSVDCHRRRGYNEDESNLGQSVKCKNVDNNSNLMETMSLNKKATGNCDKDDNDTQGAMKIPGLEETFDELMSVQQILEGFQTRAPVAAPTPTPTHNNNKTTNTLSHSTHSRPESKPKCMPLTEENIKSMKEQLKESNNNSNNNNNCLNTFNYNGRFSRLSNTNRTESDLDLYSEYRDDASTDSNLYADDEGDDNDDDGNDPYTTAEDDLDASVGEDLENNVVVSCTFYNSNTYQQQPPNLSQDIGDRSLVFTASPGPSQNTETVLSSIRGVGGDNGKYLMTPVVSCRSSTEEDIHYLNISGNRGSSSSTVGDSGSRINNDSLDRSFTPTSQNIPSTIINNNYKDSGNTIIVPNRSASYVRSNSAPGMYSGHQLSIPRAEANPNTGSYHASMAASNANNSDDEFWADHPPLERSYSYHHPRTLQQSGAAAGHTGSGASGTVSRTFQNAREQMMDIQHHLQALRRQMEGLEEDLTTSTSYTLTPDFSAYDSK